MGDVIPFPSRDDPQQPKMYCAGCGIDRTVPPAAAIPAACPECGSTSRTSHPNAIVVGGQGVAFMVSHPFPQSMPWPPRADGPR